MTDNGNPKVFARVEPELRSRVKAEADRRFEGVESMVIREALKTYLLLRETLGVQFEPTIEIWTRSADRSERVA